MPSLLPIRVKAGYGWAESGLFSVEMLVRLYLLKFYTDSVGLRPDLAGLAVASAVVWDAISDPLMGSISDKTRSKYGRRRIYLIPGALLSALFLLSLFSAPAGESQGFLFIYLLINYLLLNTAITIVAVPHAALGAELTYDAHERTVLFGFRLFLGNLGLLAGTLIPGFFLEVENQEPWFYTSMTIAGIVAISSIITFFATAGYDLPKAAKPQDNEPFSIKKHFLSSSTALKNPFFRPLLAAFLIAYIGVSINSTLALYYYDIRLGLNQQETNQILGIFIVIWSLSIAFWVFLAKKFGKKNPAFWGLFLLGLMTMVAYPLFPPGNHLWPLAASVLGGVLVGAIVLLDALVADVADYEELQSGEKKEGLYFGFWKMGIKMSRAVAIAFSGLLLQWAGYKNVDVPLSEQGERIAFLFGPVVGAFFIAGAIAFLFMPMSAAKHNQIQRLIQKRKKRYS